MKKTRVGIITVLLMLAVVPRFDVSASTPLKEIIVRCPPGVMRLIQARFGAAVIDEIPDQKHTYLVKIYSERVAQLLARFPNVAVAENTELQVSDQTAPTTTAPAVPLDWAMVPFYSSEAPRAYLDQAAVQQIQSQLAHDYSTGRGALVALIDTGVDLEHPALRNSLVPGKNYLHPARSESEYDDPVLEQNQATPFKLKQNQATPFKLKQNQATPFKLRGQTRVYDDGSSSGADLAPPPMFGHGTMVAGLIHLVAPEARLMPMKVFDANGNGQLWDVVRAIKDSVRMGADVINMSFSSDDRRRISDFIEDLAEDHPGVILVAAAGNSGTGDHQYPAAFAEVIGVAAVDENDSRAFFTNYGNWVELSAPGMNLITTYPGTYAMASGTSFSTPMVSGAFALARELGLRGVAARHAVNAALDPVGDRQLGHGRLNVLRVVQPGLQ